jgi:hypothetical protein
MTATPFSTQGPYSHFLSYYLVERWSPDCQKLVALETNIDYRMPTVNDIASVGYITDDGVFQSLFQTTAWNWQVGACQTWIDNNLLAFNIRRAGECHSVIFNTKTKKVERELPMAICCVSSKTKTAISLDFGRIYHSRPGYGYVGFIDPSHQIASPESDGLRIIPLEAPQSALLITFKQIASLLSPENRMGGHHWIDIAAFNPSGTRVAFIHRGSSRNIRMSRLLTVGTDGSMPRVLTPPSYIISHFCWLDDEIIVGWIEQSMSRHTLVKLRGIYRRGYLRTILKHKFDEGFFTIVNANIPSLGNKIAENLIRRDAHITASPDQSYFLFDTYPDQQQNRHLIIFSRESRTIATIGTFWSNPALQGDLRCDLHASFSPDGKYICFQSSHEMTRQVYVLKSLKQDSLKYL